MSSLTHDEPPQEKLLQGLRPGQPDFRLNVLFTV